MAGHSCGDGMVGTLRNSTLRRFTPLKRSTKPIPRFRSRPRRGVFRDPDYRRWVRTQACCCCGRRPCDPAHTGLEVGTSQKADDRTIVPLCVWNCHPRYHSKDGERGRALEREYGVSFGEVARQMWNTYCGLKKAA
jgi:hypothetical protein